MAINSRNGGRPRAGGALGALLVGAGVSAALAAASVARLSAEMTAHASAWRVDAAVEVGVCAAGALVASWLAACALLTAVCVLARVAGASWRAGERLVHRYAPAIVRKALVVAVGASVGLGMATGASAATPAPAPSPSASVLTAADDLGWVVTTPPAGSARESAAPEPSASDIVEDDPDVEQASTAAPAPVPVPVPGPTSTPAPPSADAAPANGSTVAVADGDSLWAIAARHLPPGASDAQIAAAWPQWYHANAATIGADPDVIHPGQVLVVPATVAGASS